MAADAGCEMTADAAAALVGTSPTILNLWQERFGYPVPVCSGDERLYPDEMMIALRDALGRELSIASAITTARRVQRQGGGRTGASRLFGRSQKDPKEAL